MSERWRDVDGFVGIYRISDRGRLLSLERTCPTAQGERRVRQRIRKATRRFDSKGRVHSVAVSLSKFVDGRQVVEVHSLGFLVLRAFVGERPGMVAHYRDGDPTNADLRNLEWSTFSAISIANGSTPPRRLRYG